MKSEQSGGSFEQAVKNLGLTDFASASWSSRETKNDRARLEGSVKTRAGGKIPLTMELVKELGAWKVIYLSAPQAGVSVEQRGKQLPSDEKSKALALDSLLAFNKAVEDKSFVGFHQQISRRWQEQITPDKLKEVFNQFIETHLDISPIKEVQPVLSAASEIHLRASCLEALRHSSKCRVAGLNDGGCDAPVAEACGKARRGDEASRPRELLAFAEFVNYNINHER